jgi:hypothetical protein
MAKRYFNLKLGKPDVMGHVIQVDMDAEPANRLTDYIASNVGEENNLQFRPLRELSQEETGIYEVVVPEMEFSGGAYAPGLAVDCSAGWSKKRQDIVSVVLSPDGELRVGEQEDARPAFIDEITPKEAERLKKAEFNWSMLQLWVAGW